MLTTTASILASARAYVDDEHAAVASWIPDATWMLWMNHEYRRAYRQAVTSGLIVPAYTDEALAYDDATDSYALSGAPMAIVGVWQGASGTSSFRKLRQAQAQGGAFPSRSEAQGTGMAWAAYSMGSDIVVKLYPSPGDVTDYTCRYVPEPLVLVAADPVADVSTTSVNIPLGLDDRIALGMARRALIKEGSGSSALERLIAQTEQDLEFAAHSRISGDAPRARSYRRTLNADTPDMLLTDRPVDWFWL